VVAESYFELFKKRDWSGVYRSSAPVLKDAGIGEGQFVALMQRVSNGLPAEYFSNITVTEHKQAPNADTDGKYYAMVTFHSAPRFESGPEFATTVVVHRLQDEWQVDSSTLPMVVATFHGKDRFERLKLLASALKEANVERYPMPAGNEIIVSRMFDAIASGKDDHRYIQRRNY